MKSSNSILSHESSAGLESWLPSEFDARPAMPIEARVEDLLAILKLDQERAAHPIVSSLQPDRADVSSWQPDELEWTPPFNMMDWLNMGDLHPTQHDEQVEAVHVPQQHAEHPNPVNLAEEEAAAILEQARKQAEEILIQAQKTVDDAMNQAQDELSNAKGEGYRQGWANAEEESSSVLKAAQEIVSQFTLWRDGMFAQSETMILEMVKQIGRSMFGDGLELEPKVMEANLNRVVENAKSLGDLKVYLNPFDADKLDPGWREYQQLISGNRVQIIPSDGIKPGGCFVQGQMGTVDARVETQLKTVMEVFEQEETSEEVA
jgi:flagellar assembly protein FliH